MATTFTIVAVFVPVAFMGGIIGRFFYQFGVTVAWAVLVSLFVSFTLDPDAARVGGASTRDAEGSVAHTRRALPRVGRHLLDRLGRGYDGCSRGRSATEGR